MGQARQLGRYVLVLQSLVGIASLPEIRVYDRFKGDAHDLQPCCRVVGQNDENVIFSKPILCNPRLLVASEFVS
jgi:hypothetical protein